MSDSANVIQNEITNDRANVNQDKECSICLDDIGSINCAVLECAHTVHTSCLLRWYKTSRDGGSCPMCRRILLSGPQIRLFRLPVDNLERAHLRELDVLCLLTETIVMDIAKRVNVDIDRELVQDLVLRYFQLAMSFECLSEIYAITHRLVHKLRDANPEDYLDMCRHHASQPLGMYIRRCYDKDREFARIYEEMDASSAIVRLFIENNNDAVAH